MTMTLLKPTAAQSLRIPTLSSYGGEPIINWESYADILPQACSCDGGGEESYNEGDSAPPSYIYSTLGKVRPVFPSLTIEKEFYQVAPPNSVYPPTPELLFQVLSQVENLYLAREMCWVFTIAKVDSYIIKAISDEEVLALVEASKPFPKNPSKESLSTVVGPQGPVPPSGACNGLELPIVLASDFFFLSLNQYVQEIEEQIGDEPVELNVKLTIGILWEAAINPGNTDSYRALNFVLTKYLGLYSDAYRLLYPPAPPAPSDSSPPSPPSPPPVPYSFVGVTSQPALLQGDQKIYDVIFSYQAQTNGMIKKRYCQVNITTEFPYLFQGMGEYITTS
ncbi:hypothetical protein [Okeania sp. SIO2B3]|uniref:hypothetical protein n=1 Tax=Okeania sp. SIO2B3 TaxID=2607784 RepID=UPI0013C15136|nr:hypothetical protein [Okeania sp. SIO2B3]NET46283.1 hypothetical protein [Okeania sp. SIO2B3]